MYANDFHGDLCGNSIFAPTTLPTFLREPSDHDENWAYPTYVQNAKVFVCPSTLNSVNIQNTQKLFPSGQIVVVDLEDSGCAANRNATTGQSYYIFGAVDEGPASSQRQVLTSSQYPYWHKKKATLTTTTGEITLHTRELNPVPAGCGFSWTVTAIVELPIKWVLWTITKLEAISDSVMVTPGGSRRERTGQQFMPLATTIKPGNPRP